MQGPVGSPYHVSPNPFVPTKTTAALSPAVSHAAPDHSSEWAYPSISVQGSGSPSYQLAYCIKGIEESGVPFEGGLPSFHGPTAMTVGPIPDQPPSRYRPVASLMPGVYSFAHVLG